MTELEDLDFTRPAKSEIYDPAVARLCFEALGSTDSVAAGQPFFAEDEASEKMYLLLEGEVSLIRGKKIIDIVKPGEVFGEMAAITHQPRSATAMARGACRTVSLDAKQFQHAIQKTPEFALMLMSILINRLRLTDAMARMTRSIPDWAGKADSRVFDAELVHDFAAALPQRPPQRCLADCVIFREGEGGVFMYVVLKGRVVISIQSTVVEKVGPGGVFGEMALADQSARAATAIAETACVLLAINRNDFLSLVKTKPAFAVSLLRALAQRIRHMGSRQS
jgi:CRP/FNR family transcriptional regulator, cyclic AMP receptor protein